MISLSKIPFRLTAFWALCTFWVALTFSSALVEITFVVALIAWAGWKIQSRKLLSNRMPVSLLIPFAGFVLLSVLSYFWSDSPSASVRGITKVLQHVSVFWLVADVIEDRRDINRFEKIFVGLMLFTVVNGTFQYVFNRDLLRGFPCGLSHSGLRVSASFHSYGQLASFLICAIPYLTGLFFYFKHRGIKSWWTITAGIAVPGTLWILFLTRSRGAYLAFLIGMGLFLVFRRHFLLLAGMIMICASSLFVLPRTMILHLDTEFKEQSLVERFYLWDRALHVIKAKPLTGTGINTYAAAHAKYDQTQNWRVKGYYAHNGYLQMAAETGLPCLGLFLIFLAQYFRFSWQHLRALEQSSGRYALMGILVGICNFLVFGFVDTVFHNPQPVMIFWFLMGLQWAYQRAR